jgi:hypothetical protein
VVDHHDPLSIKPDASLIGHEPQQRQQIGNTPRRIDIKTKVRKLLLAGLLIGLGSVD